MKTSLNEQSRMLITSGFVDISRANFGAMNA
jgi:hypothetical protein